MPSQFDTSGPSAANHVPLSPVSFLNRAAAVHGPRPAVVYGAIRRNWRDFEERVRRVAGGLRARGVGKGDIVSVICPNIPQLYELHYAVPMIGAVLNTINTRLEPDTVAYILDHAESRMIIADSAYLGLVQDALSRRDGSGAELVTIVDAEGQDAGHTAALEYETLAASALFDGTGLPEDEWQPLALNYTSGTSGRPKGVVYHHRGAALMAMGTVNAWAVPHFISYLSIVPMFHCNGWCHPWMLPLVGGKMVFTRDPVPARLFEAIETEKVTHFGAAPIVLQMLAESSDAPAAPFSPRIRVMTAGAPPPPAILEKTGAMGLDVMQVYGLTETYGHILQCLWQDEWDALSPAEQAELQAHQGIAFPMVEEVAVIDRATGARVPKDGQTQGEIAIRSNTVMREYYKDPAATAEAFADGWFWSGDAAVVHENGYIQIRDRLKDVIISGGENISSVEVEAVLYRHPDVQAAAVVAKPDAKWGEVPCAFVEPRPGAAPDADAIIAFCRARLAGFKTPKSVVFGTLPKTATGKIRKFELRQQAREEG
ncbi:AMP-binding protein [Alphaproteobacteria bacterium GH1-50]|uniref:3-methylmercaptopropionyl-CoA ligase n=1 Tax=Kangsaoukella pontilimi TaxID=2691042 RepID=A0A7C9MUW6_9RHOB|nr:AMP-binding protein [Kangsaoukella pontilimi]MXQ06434.1 AMP-binding protein [Kangsaoukella pontilimi]